MSPSRSSGAPPVVKPAEKRPTRGRPPKIDSKKLLQVAREVFLERGIQATTLEVATRAGVSEGTLFHRFKTKQALFGEAMQLTDEELPKRVLEAIESTTGDNLREWLEQLGRAFLTLGKVAVPLMMMSWSNPNNVANNNRKSKEFRVAHTRLVGVFEQAMDAGQLRQMDAEIVVRTFVGALHYYSMSRVMEPDATWIVPESIFVRGLVDLVLRGAETRSDT